jgi:hypothetical protein
MRLQVSTFMTVLLQAAISFAFTFALFKFFIKCFVINF